jgi:hypothetical protein
MIAILREVVAGTRKAALCAIVSEDITVSPALTNMNVVSRVIRMRLVSRKENGENVYATLVGMQLLIMHARTLMNAEQTRPHVTQTSQLAPTPLEASYALVMLDGTASTRAGPATRLMNALMGWTLVALVPLALTLMEVLHALVWRDGKTMKALGVASTSTSVKH